MQCYFVPSLTFYEVCFCTCYLLLFKNLIHFLSPSFILENANRDRVEQSQPATLTDDNGDHQIPCLPEGYPPHNMVQTPPSSNKTVSFIK